MSAIFYRGLQFIFEDTEGEHVLLDCGDFLSNKSSVPMHRFPEQDMITIPEFLNALCEMEQGRSQERAFPAFLLDVLLVAELIRSKEPVKLLEYGSGSGEYSQHLAEILGVFHEESILVCANNSINPEWENNIGQIAPEYLPKLSYYAGDFGDIHLEQNYFGLIFVNGTTNFEQPDLVIKNVVGMATEDAMILLLTDDTPLLESTFRLFFRKYEEYAISSLKKVFVAKVVDCDLI